MAGMMGSKQIYKDSPKLSRGADGKMGVHKKEPSPSGKDEADDGEGGMPVQQNEMSGRHNLDRHMMHAKHEHEHAMHKGGDKKEMHVRHHTEIKAMMKKHEDEMAGAEGGAGRQDMMGKGEEE